MDDENLRITETVGFGVRLSLGAQLASTGQLVSTLIASGVLSKQQAREFLVKLAETIMSSLEEPATDLESIAKGPLQEHAEALRKLATDLGD